MDLPREERGHEEGRAARLAGDRREERRREDRWNTTNNAAAKGRRTGRIESPLQNSWSP